jgi:hypothetical protein
MERRNDLNRSRRMPERNAKPKFKKEEVLASVSSVVRRDTMLKNVLIRRSQVMAANPPLD